MGGVRRRVTAQVAVVVLALAGLVAAPSAALAVKPLWKLTVVVDVPNSVAAKHGGPTLMLSKIMTQFGDVARFMNEDQKLAGTIDFSISKVNFFDGVPADVVHQPHPGVMTRVVYEEDQTEARGGSYGGDLPAAILHSWPTDRGGVFGPYATDGLVHEFGHQRGAIDNYGQDVDAASNPVDAKGFTSPTSIMENPYGVHTWDAFAAGVINRAGPGEGNVVPALASQSFPRTIRVRVVTSSGAAFRGATVRLYPVEWFSRSVRPESVFVGKTDSSGYLVLPYNPFEPGVGKGAWDVRYANFLVRATTTNRGSGSGWMPLSAVGGTYYSGATTHTVKLVLR
ncbi:hypothetical protein [Streptomyces sp. NP160]|uniref:hypothetical protein n=1 Tax=Streptomyces sp. NP160 TaxID=2586637 RepID=UPI00111A2F57|nr:hypothetical protein [Streptomyces sp. NP160]